MMRKLLTFCIIVLLSVMAVDARPMKELRRLADAGFGVETAINYDEAALWFRKAAEQGDAQYLLGICYLEGQGVSENKTEAV